MKRKELTSVDKCRLLSEKFNRIEIWYAKFNNPARVFKAVAAGLFIQSGKAWKNAESFGNTPDEATDKLFGDLTEPGCHLLIHDRASDKNKYYTWSAGKRKFVSYKP